ncbi:transcription initiation factor TFIID subunit 1 [Trichomonascus vanleenenianus]|uniref:histone acetyltransferase n=1 Tax=Trichomonascus vanleenenianus TaxID=2268995 RepID=UPI003ECAAE69
MADESDDDFYKFLKQNETGMQSIPDLGGGGKMKHAEDAIDFEDEDELADDDDEMMKEEEEERKMKKAEAEDDGFFSLGEMMDEDHHHDHNHEAAEDEHGPHVPDSDHIVDEDLAIMMGDAGYDHEEEDDWAKNLGLEPFREKRIEAEKEKNPIVDGTMTVADEILENPDFVQVGADIENDVSRTLEVMEGIEQNNEEKLLKAYYPDFQPGAVLKMNSLFGPKPSKTQLPRPKVTRQCVPSRVSLEVEFDQKSTFKSNIERPRGETNVIRVSEASLNKLLNDKTEDEELRKRRSELDKELVLASTEWEVPGLFSGSSEGGSDVEMIDGAASKALISSKKRRALPLFRDGELYDSDDEDAFLEGSFKPSKKKAKLDLNDPYLLFVDDTHQRRVQQMARKRTSKVPTSERQLMQRYNISNDRAYDMLKENYQSKVRATIGNLNIDHSMVALRLQSPHYKVKLSKAQMRSHHRPSFVVKPNTTISFSKIKQRKKKKDKGKHITQLLNKTNDLTLGDSAGFFMLEYSEEFPLVLSNFGMGSKLINYYRKKSNDDTTRPKLPVGETHVLSVQDRSAFWNFGFVESGNVVPTLYNRMVRAPIFKHGPPKTDFLLIRTTGGGQGQRYFLRTIPHLFVVGQTLPVVAIPGPHSRKVTTASKNRLKMVVYRVLNQNERHRLVVKDISAHFPDQNDMQNRQRLKEFMEYQRAGEDQGYWKVKASEPLPTEESIRAMIAPEDISLLEAMQVGQQHLEDAGYGKSVEDDKEDEEGMSIEEQLAPWNITRNFINATQGKAMLQLHGEGDPSGRGEAFSFLRTSMKGGFKAMGESVNDKLDKSKFGGHSYNVAMQQKAYDEEIARIWYTQKRSLEVTNVEDLGWDEAESKRENADNNAFGAESANVDDEGSLFSQKSTFAQQSNKVLRITRLYTDENGTKRRKTEIVKDPNVIRAYVKRREKIEDAQLATDQISLTNDEERNRRQKKFLQDELARLKRNKDRRMARKAMKGSESSPGQSGKGVGKGKSTTRKCATCGAIGHIRTNKSCPLYNERFGDGNVDAAALANAQKPM